MKVTYKGIIFTRVLRYGSSTKYKWDGGEMGGIVFEDETETGPRYGVSGMMHESFEAAADLSIAAYRKRYENAKKITDAYEAELQALGERVMWEPAT